MDCGGWWDFPHEKVSHSCWQPLAKTRSMWFNVTFFKCHKTSEYNWLKQSWQQLPFPAGEEPFSQLTDLIKCNYRAASNLIPILQWLGTSLICWGTHQNSFGPFSRQHKGHPDKFHTRSICPDEFPSFLSLKGTESRFLWSSFLDVVWWLWILSIIRGQASMKRINMPNNGKCWQWRYNKCLLSGLLKRCSNLLKLHSKKALLNEQGKPWTTSYKGKRWSLFQVPCQFRA